MDRTNGRIAILIPSLWNAIPDLRKRSARADLLYANANSVIVAGNGLGPGEGIPYTAGLYQFDLSSRRITTPYIVGDCAAPNSDSPYVADEYPNAHSGTSTIKVFSFDTDAYVYSYDLSASQALDDGSLGFPSPCEGNFKWNGYTLSYTIYDKSNDATRSLSVTRSVVATKQVDLPRPN